MEAAPTAKHGGTNGLAEKAAVLASLLLAAFLGTLFCSCYSPLFSKSLAAMTRAAFSAPGWPGFTEWFRMWISWM